MPRKINKQKIPSQIPTLHTDVWSLIFPYLKGTDIVNLCVANPPLMKKLTKEAKEKGRISFLPSELRVQDGDVVTIGREEFQISTQEYIRNEHRFDFLSLYDFLVIFYSIALVDKSPYVFPKVKANHVPKVCKLFKEGDILSIYSGNTIISYFVFEKKGKLHVQRIYYGLLPTYAFSFFKRKNINSLSKLNKYYPKQKFHSIGLRITEDNKITHDTKDRHQVFIFGNNDKVTQTICGLNFYGA